VARGSVGSELSAFDGGCTLSLLTDSPLVKARADFPALTQRVRGKPWIYLDSAATALKPWPVIERIGHYYTYETANVHRGAFFVADRATGFFEDTRKKVQALLNASHVEEVIFTKGATESINLVAQSWGFDNLGAGDEILLTEMEHHANIVPWQMIAERKGAKVLSVPVTPSGELDMSAFQRLISPRTKIVAVTHCSNVLGTVNDLKFITTQAHAAGALVLVDGAQMVANFAVDVQGIDADFYVFSAHKLFGPYGTGVLYGKKEHLEKMTPYQGGGSMISEVTFERTSYNSIPYKFEAGTPNIEGVIALGAAIDYINKWGFAVIHDYENALLVEATEKLLSIPGLRIFGQAPVKAPIVSFTVGGIHPSDLAQILDQENVAIRAGHLCAQPLMTKMGTKGFVRASFSIFNQSSDIDRLVQAVIKAKEMLT
jgi:cysteine desulfurase/selenocysteine lyase